MVNLKKLNRPANGLAVWRSLPPLHRSRVAGFIGYLALMTLLFIQPLMRLMLYAYTAQGGLYSHILIIPFIVGYLLYIEWAWPSAADRSSIPGIIMTGGSGIAALTVATVWHGNMSGNDELALIALAFVSFVAAGGFLFFGAKWMAAMAFPFAFLIFMVPLPESAVKWLEDASAAVSAEVAAAYLKMTGLLLARHGTILDLPGISFQVAPECSGIRSTWVLFLATLLASHLFLRTRWHRIVVTALVVPIGILRNGFRIWVLGLLCVRIGPHMLDSPIHRKGGPLFLALSLIPMSLLFLWLRSRESRDA
jgi:exosortase